MFRLSWIYTILFVGLVSFGCKTGKNAQGAKLDNALLWKIEAPGTKTPSYLFGTIHIIDSKEYFLPNGTLSAIDASKKMVFEIDMAEMSDPSKLMGMMGKVMMKNGKTLKDVVSAEDYIMIQNHFKKMGLPMFMFERMKPFFLTIFAEEGLDPAGLQSGNLKSYEMEFAELAREKDMETGGLETIDFQIGLFDQITDEDQAKMLVDAITSDKKDDGSMDKMIALYKAQNIDALATMIDDGGKDIEGFNEKLLTDRNKQWIDGITTEVKKQPTFIAVGAGHLGGKDGVVRLLRQAGLKVTAVK